MASVLALCAFESSDTVSVLVTCKVTFRTLTEMHLHALKAMSQDGSDILNIP